MTSLMEAPKATEAEHLSCDVAIVGGGTAGTMAAITAAESGASVLLIEKAHVRHSGALAMGMDGVNNAVIPGKASPQEYVAEITRANDGVVNQRTIYQTASRGFDMVQRLERYGVKFAKDAAGEYDVRRVHRSGSYVLPMPEGKDIKKVLYRVLRQRSIRERVRIENRVMPVRVLTAAGRAVGVAGFNTRTGEFVTVSAGAVILATGACGRLGLRRAAAAWEVRVGAVRALAAARPVIAVGPLVAAVSDPHANVRKAAVTALAPMRAYPGVAEALHTAASDGDADVRAHARYAVDGRTARARSS